MHSPKHSASGNLLKNLDYSVVQQCMHCGLCLPTCPTYDVTKMERNSPRGRISLMRAIADGELSPGKAFADEMYFCLGCLACMTACPAGVDYASLFEHARAEAEHSKANHSWTRRLIRKLTIGCLFMDQNRLQLLGSIIRLYQQCGLQRLLRGSGVLNWFPKRMRELESMTPDVEAGFSSDLISPITPAAKPSKYRVAMLTGCAQDLIFSKVNADTVEVLARNGCEVITPAQQHCCGSLHAHNGDLDLARILARRQIDLFPPENFDAIITNAAGCGTHLKNYGNLLADDVHYAGKALLWDSKLKDIHEWLVQIGIVPPRDCNRLVQKVTYHEACHLCHGQKITRQPRAILGCIPGLKLEELAESTWCCGSAGIYNIIQPEMAGQLLDRKMKNISRTDCMIVATANPGCILQIVNGAKSHSMPIRVVHPITLLAEAYRRE